MASVQATERRRENRASVAASARSRDQHDREVAVRMSRRFFPIHLYPEGPPLMAMDYRYYQALRCGWDALDVAWCYNAAGKPCHPMDSIIWWWWTRIIHYKQRGQLVRMSNIRLMVGKNRR